MTGTSSALAPESLRDGAVVSFDRDTLVVSGGRIVDAVTARARTERIARPAPNPADLIEGVVPILRRGEAWIVPLSFVPAAAADRPIAGETLRMRAAELARSVASACWFGHGEPIDIDLDETERAYTAELRRTGARQASWWEVDGAGLVLVHYGAADDDSSTRSALHVVPAGWVSTRRPTPPKKMPPLDLDWSWVDVVAAAADSLGPTGGEEHQ